MPHGLNVRLRRLLAPFPWSDSTLGRQWALAAFGWSIAALLSYTRYILGPDAPNYPGALVMLPLWAGCYGGWSLSTPALGWLVWRHPLDRLTGDTRWQRVRGFLSRLSWHLVVGAGVTILVTYLTFSLNGLCLDALGYSPEQPQTIRRPGTLVVEPIAVVTLFAEWLVCVAAVTVLTGAHRWHEARRREQEVARLTLERLELENDLRDAQLQALRMKLNPHFLFNALQTVAALVRSDPRAAERMLARVGDVLRMALRLDLSAEISLKQELEVAQAYLDLEKIRFQDRLNVTFAVEPDLVDAMVPSLILQPLIENAIRHGVSRRRGEAELRVEGWREGTSLKLAILDNGIGFSVGPTGEPKPGIGLGVVRSRLEKLYPGDGACLLENRPEGGAKVELTMPLRRAESRSDHAA